MSSHIFGESKFKATKWPFFSFAESDGCLLFLGKPISQETIKETKMIHKFHVVPEQSERYCLESLIFTLVNRDIFFERVAGFMNNIRNLSIDELYDAEAIMSASKSTIKTTQLRLDFSGNGEQITTFDDYFHITKTQDIFSSALNFVKTEGQNGGILEVVQKYMDNPLEYRKHIVKNVMHMGYKLASMWYLCLGGNGSVLTLDRHVCRQLVNLGLDLDSKYYLGNVRSTGRSGNRKIVETLNGKKYDAAESEALAILEKHNFAEHYPDFVEADYLHGGLITTLFWWQGVKHHRKYSLNPVTDEKKLRLLFQAKYSEKNL